MLFAMEDFCGGILVAKVITKERGEESEKETWGKMMKRLYSLRKSTKEWMAVKQMRSVGLQFWLSARSLRLVAMYCEMNLPLGLPRL